MEALNTQSLDALERASTQSARDEHEKEADAAAGPEDARSSQSDLLLPLEARGKSRVGCAQQAHLEQALADTAQLQSQADAALERMTRQSRALKRIPVTCPSCGTLNVPMSASTWSVGDLVPCQECSQPFLPLSNSFQETDLLVLKTAVKRLRDQAEQIQYLEILLQKKKSSPTAPGSGRRLSPAVPQEPWSPSRFGSPEDHLDGRQFLSPCSPIRNDRAGRSGDLTPSTPESGHLEAAGAPSVLKQSAPVSRLPIAGDPLSPPRQAARDDRMPQPQLMSFLDTQDLLTNSSSSSAPMFHGSKLASQLDTEQKTREVLHRLREDLPDRRSVRKREREEGEIFSASESEAGSRWPSQEMRLRSSSGLPPRKQGAESRLLEESPSGSPSGPSPVTNGIGQEYLLKLFACLSMVCSLRCLLRRCATAEVATSEVATSILAALVTGGGLTLWRWAEQTVERQNQLETSKSLSSFKHGLVCVHWELGGRDWQLSTEEAFGLACLLGELAPVFVFENWGLHGSARYRWMAVVAHVASSLGLVVLVRRKLAIQVSEAWMGLAAGNWVASTWAAYTWWPAAGDQVRLPVLALATVQLVNFWLAQSSGQPLLLASCIALGGLSMAGVCLTPVAAPPSQGPLPLLAPGIYLGFCVVSALLLFQEFFMSL